jgi:hypothetical protein
MGESNGNNRLSDPKSESICESFKGKLEVICVRLRNSKLKNEKMMNSDYG